jgi:hypothetical protein
MTGWRSAPEGFDVRDEKRVRGLRCLRDAVDTWAREGRNALDEDMVLAALIRLFAAPESYRYFPIQGSISSGDVPALPIRPLTELNGLASTAAEECARVAPQMTSSVAAGVVHLYSHSWVGRPTSGRRAIPRNQRPMERSEKLRGCSIRTDYYLGGAKHPAQGHRTTTGRTNRASSSCSHK